MKTKTKKTQTQRMKNITFSADEKVINHCRRLATKRRTTLTQMLRDFMAREGTREQTLGKAAASRFLETADALSKDLAVDWNREDAYEHLL